TGEVELGDLVGDWAKLALLIHEIDVDHFPERTLGRHPLRCLLALWIRSERDAGENLARALAGLRQGQPFGAAERDAAGAAVGAVLRDVSAALALQTQSEARELCVPSECFALSFAQIQGGDGLGIKFQLHGILELGST